jgi:superfamily II DNA/RNA helicase
LDEQQQQKPETDSDAESSETGNAPNPKPVHSRQTLLCSATLTTGIEQLSEISLRHPGKVKTG